MANDVWLGVLRDRDGGNGNLALWLCPFRHGGHAGEPGGGPFKEGYNVVSGIDKYMPVDVYVPGCPPTPQALIYGFIKLHEKIENQSFKDMPWYQNRGESEAIPVPILGPDIFDPRQIPLIKAEAAKTKVAAAAESESE
jgi:NADH-quinone oxidoreductase subunit B